MLPIQKSYPDLFVINWRKPHKSVSLVVATAAIILLSSWSKLYHYVSNASGNLAITHHQLKLDNHIIQYKTSTGYIPITDKNNKPLANIFYADYTADNTTNKRPITFVFNGGPGSASIWLHMGSFSPVRVLFKNDKGDAPDGPYQYGDNPNSWLGFTDLVFIDPVSTGYSRPQKGVDAKQFYGYQADISSIGEFIKLYLIQHNRQNSLKFLAGESYGSLRAIGLAEYLQDNYGVSFNGITLISPALNYQLINFNKGNQTPYGYYLPSYAVAAQYHNRLSPQLQKLTVEQLVAKASAFANGLYSQFLSGDTLSTTQVIDSLHYYTGLSKTYIRSVNGRISDKQFYKALLKSDNLTIGGFDSRFTGEGDQNADPSEVNLRGLFTSAFKNYVSNDLKYHSDSVYNATTNVGQWNNGGHTVNGYLNIAATLKKIMNQNPNLKINIASGYYDLATPVGTTEYVVKNLGLNAELRSNISINYYKSGHMVYISESANAKFKNDAGRFYQAALN